MTRFARAKGSKSSNERVPEDATPWSVMKEQLQRAKEEAEYTKLREQAEKKRLGNYENFLKERKTAKQKSTWCEFPDDGNKTSSKIIKEKGKKTKFNQFDTNKTEQAEEVASIDVVSKSIKKKNKRKHLLSQSSDLGGLKIDQIEKMAVSNITDESPVSKKKKKMNPSLTKSLDHSFNIEETNENTSISIVKNKHLKVKKKNRNKSLTTSLNQGDNIEKTNEKTIIPDEANKDLKNKNKKKNSQKKSVDHKESSNKSELQNKSFDHEKNSEETELVVASNTAIEHSKKKNKRDGLKTRRKPQTDNSFQIIINGRQVELVRYDGFPVMKKDAERMRQLRKDMTTKGIPKKEIDRTMKLERRRAEKALARVKRDVCYNCRKGGHNISSCPDLRSIIPERGPDSQTDIQTEGGTNQIETADGICFKCGSTEHRQSECRVQKGQQFRFASCFICKEQGHIARQCPDNPKGLYPNGGGCKLCGDVTHLRKDCPTTKTSKEESSVRLETLASSKNVEDFPSNVSASQSSVNKKPKKIKF